MDQALWYICFKFPSNRKFQSYRWSVFFLASAKGSSENCMEDILYLWALEEGKKCVAYFRNPFEY